MQVSIFFKNFHLHPDKKAHQDPVKIGILRLVMQNQTDEIKDHLI